MSSSSSLAGAANDICYSNMVLLLAMILNADIGNLVHAVTLKSKIAVLKKAHVSNKSKNSPEYATNTRSEMPEGTVARNTRHIVLVESTNESQEVGLVVRPELAFFRRQRW